MMQTLRDKLFSVIDFSDAGVKAMILGQLNDMASAANEKAGASYLQARDDWKLNARQAHDNGKAAPAKPTIPRLVYVKPDLYMMAFDGKPMFEPEPDFAPPPPLPKDAVVIGVLLSGNYYQCPVTDTAAVGREYTDVRGTFVKTQVPWGFYWVKK